METLPREMIVKIAEYLDYKELLLLKQTSRKNYNILNTETKTLVKIIDLVSFEGTSTEDAKVFLNVRGYLEEIPFPKTDYDFYKQAVLRKFIFAPADYSHFGSFQESKSGRSLAFLEKFPKTLRIHELDFSPVPKFSENQQRYFNRWQETLFLRIKPKYFTFRWSKSFSITTPFCLEMCFFKASTDIDKYTEMNQSQTMDLEMQFDADLFMAFLEGLQFRKVRMNGGGCVFAKFSVDATSRSKILEKLASYWIGIEKFTKLRQELPTSDRKMVLFLKDWKKAIEIRITHKPKPSTIGSHFQKFDTAYLV